MERLTYEKRPSSWNLGKYPTNYTSRHTFQEVVARLAAYEDTMPLERAQELAQAEKDGRLVVLPCKITDTVYITEAVYNKKKFVGDRIVSAQIDHVTIGGTTGKPVFDLCTETQNWYYSMGPNQFYLSRKEAEAALKKREDMK